MDPLLLEAMREVDAMYPDTPPIATQERVPGRLYEVDCRFSDLPMVVPPLGGDDFARYTRTKYGDAVCPYCGLTGGPHISVCPARTMYLASLTRAQRSAIASQASRARWAAERDKARKD